MLVVEFRIDSPILREALARAPETTITYEELYHMSGKTGLLFWVEGGDLAAFDENLPTDPSVTDSVELTETETRRLYRVTYTAHGETATTVPLYSELDISFLAATATHEGWDVRLRMTDRDTLRKYVAMCAERNLQLQLQSVYEESDAATTADARLTNVQREAMVTARRLGYFAVPRQASLADVADQCDVSSQAVSERIRRGTATLVDTALLTGRV